MLTVTDGNLNMNLDLNEISNVIDLESGTIESVELVIKVAQEDTETVLQPSSPTKPSLSVSFTGEPLLREAKISVCSDA